VAVQSGKSLPAAAPAACHESIVYRTAIQNVMAGIADQIDDYLFEFIGITVQGAEHILWNKFLSPASKTGFVWGAGPVIQAPSATSTILGAGKWAAGPTAVAVFMEGPFVLGALANNRWSFAGDGSRSSYNQMLLQPFLNYNLPDGWSLGTFAHHDR